MSEGDSQPQNAPVVLEAHEVKTYGIPEPFFKKGTGKAHLKDMDEYNTLYKQSIEEPDKFWGKMARDLLTWDRDFQTVKSGSLTNGDVAWFLEGQLNASYNCVDRHAFKNPDKPAIFYEADDTVAIYLPMIPEAVIAFLAATRIGACHTVVFAGFSSGSLADRINDADAKVCITTDEGKRGGKLISTKKIVDEALKKCPGVTSVIVYKRTGADVPWTKGRDFWWSEETEKYPSYCPPVPMMSEDPLFLLYTSGSTGKPKGVMHTTGGYLVGAAATGKYVFDPNSGEEIKGNDVEGVLAFKQAWPSMARTVWGAHKRYMDTYLNVYKGYYFTGDGAARDHEGYYWIRGRVDDVVNVSGHRLSTAEIEAALIEHQGVAEAAVVGVNDEMTGQAVNAFVALKDGVDGGDGTRKELIMQVRKQIGPFAAPKGVFIVDDLPKTRSGKIMRRILRKILSGEEDSLGDISTLSDPSVVDKIIETVKASKK